MMPEDNRTALMGGLWFVSALVLVALFISAAAQGELTAAHMGFASVILALAVAGTVFLRRWGEREVGREKAKRQGLDDLLHDMSNEDLMALKQRLADLDGHEEDVSAYVGDDGELLWRG